MIEERIKEMWVDDAEWIKSHLTLQESTKGKTWLITGSTGLIGKTLINSIQALDKSAVILAPVRNEQKALRELAVFIDNSGLLIYEDDCVNYTNTFANHSDISYIVHCAAPTNNAEMAGRPVEVAEYILNSTMALLHHAKDLRIERFINLSSIEAYGNLSSEEKITEETPGVFDVFSPRSSYPIAKFASEALCTFYHEEYGVPVITARLTQTSGVGASQSDGKIPPSFCRLASLGSDLILHTPGVSARNYCCSLDAATAILTMIEKGKNGEIYNVSPDEKAVSARDLAEMIAKFGKIEVRTEITDGSIYPPVNCKDVNNSKLKSLGWKSEFGAEATCRRLIEWYGTIESKL